MDSNTKNLLKKPKSGGIPAIENNTNVKVIVSIEFLDPAEIQLTVFWKIFLLYSLNILILKTTIVLTWSTQQRKRLRKKRSLRKALIRLII